MGKYMIFVIVIVILTIITMVQFTREKKDNIQNNNMNGSTNGMNSSNNNITTSSYSGKFYMPIEDVFKITSKGVVLTGKIEKGTLRLGDKVEVLLDDNRKIQTTVLGIETLTKLKEVAYAGDNVGILIGEQVKEKNVKYVAVQSISE